MSLIEARDAGGVEDCLFGLRKARDDARRLSRAAHAMTVRISEGVRADALRGLSGVELPEE